MVLEQLQGVGTDTGLVAKVLEFAQKRAKALILGLEYERQTLTPKIGQYGAELRGITLNPDHTSERVLKRIAHLQEKIAEGQLRLKEIPRELERLQAILKQESDQAAILAQFDLVWSHLNNREQYQFLHLLIRRIDYDGRTGEIEIFFHETGTGAIDQIAIPQAQGNVA